MAFKIQIISNAVEISDTVSGEILISQPARDSWFEEESLDRDLIVFYGTTSTNEDNIKKYRQNDSSFIGFPIADCVDATDTPFTTSTFRDFCYVSLGKSSASGGGAYLRLERLVNGISLATEQQPTGYGEANSIQIEFGAAQNTVSDPVQLLADGSVVFNEEGLYRLKITLIFGRLGGAGESELRFRAMINGVQAGQSIGAEIDSQRIEIPYSDEAWLNIPEGTVITYEVMRDSSGNDSGGLFQPVITNATAPNWNPTTCAAIRVERYEQ